MGVRESDVALSSRVASEPKTTWESFRGSSVEIGAIQKISMAPEQRDTHNHEVYGSEHNLVCQVLTRVA